MKSSITPTTEKRIRVGCPAHYCGGRCLLIAHVRDGRIVRLDADDRPDSVAAPQLRACVRGRSYLRQQYHPDRLTRSLKLVANIEEIRPRRPSAWEDMPLILFTLLTQMAVGGFWAMLRSSR